ncbi:MAG: DNA-protecting protein DprA [Acidaminococcaceae bacterium]|nr:DNA-protecting protein DprA [Acidaminococcaceae bacterium]
MKKDIEKLMENILFSKEAADYLGITVQRLNQLVHDGQITPVKKGSAGMLFYKPDIEARRVSINSIGINISKSDYSVPMKIDSAIKQEAVNYYTIQSFYNGSAKTAFPIFTELKEEFDVSQPLLNFSEIVSKRLNINIQLLEEAYQTVEKGFLRLRQSDVILKKGNDDFPENLATTDQAPPFLFARGDIELLKQKIVSVVGSRKASPEGCDKAYRLSSLLGRYQIVVASGLARGIDTQAHMAALKENNGRTIAVIGTSLETAYPAENKYLQEKISEKGLLLSQFAPSEKVQRWFFPVRNAVMSGISLATVVVEAGETSGALKQADYALKQNRFVFIPQSALDNNKIKWPKKYITQRGAHKFRTIKDLLEQLQQIPIFKNTNAVTELALFQDDLTEVEYVSES